MKSVRGVILVRIFPYSDWIRRNSVSLRIQSECGKMRIRITPNNECISFRPYPCILSYSFQVNLLEPEGSTTNPVPYTTIQGMKMNNKVIQIFKSTLRADCRACSQFLKICLFISLQVCRSPANFPLSWLPSYLVAQVNKSPSLSLHDRSSVARWHNE